MIAQGTKQIPLILLRRRSSRISETHRAKALKLSEVKLEEPGPKRVCDDESSGQEKLKTKRAKRGNAKVTAEPNDVKPHIIEPNSFDGLLELDTAELNLERTLLGGQSFRWTKSNGYLEGCQIDLFTGVVEDMVLRLWRHNSKQIAYTLLNKSRHVANQPSQLSSFLAEYFQLNYNLKDLYETWSAKDEHMRKACRDYQGFRILRQSPVENVFSFICATNNNIKRISQMVEKLCKRFGDKLLDSHHKFPEIERLASQGVEDCLRNELGFGYRAKYITGTAKKLLQLSERDPQLTPRNYLLQLRQLSYKDACKNLMQLPGIGRKVADCICLMSMDHLNAVPTDCHIYEIVCRNYLPELRNRKANLNEAVHDQIHAHFNDLHGSLAGWSTSVLFIGELRHLKTESTATKCLSGGLSI